MTGIVRRLVSWLTGVKAPVSPGGDRMLIAVASVLEKMGPSWQLDKVELLPRGDVVRVTLTFRDPEQRFTGEGIYRQAEYVLGAGELTVRAYTGIEKEAP